MRFAPFLICMLFTFFSHAQLNVQQENSISIGGELGVSNNLSVRETRPYIGLIMKYKPKLPWIQFDSGIRYQNKGNNYREFRSLMVPIDINFSPFNKEHKLRLFFSAGSAVELDIDSYLAAISSRIGGKLQLEKIKGNIWTLQFLFTRRFNTENLGRSSPGGRFVDDIVYLKTLELGLSFVRRIYK